jgi:predicted nucleic acid-binding protein
MTPSTSARSAVVVDASAIVDFVLDVRSVVRRLGLHALHAPVTIDAEVLHGLRRKWLSDAVTDEEAEIALALFHRIEIERYPVRPFVARMWALRHNVTAYDAGYVALAESLELPLLTRDRRLSRASGHVAHIEYIDT